MADTHPPRPRLGEPFNPYKRFNNILIPEAMGRSREVEPGAKLVYGRLRRYAGADGRCYPSVGRLAEEVALGKRQVQKHLSALEARGFLQRVRRFDASRAQMSNAFVFLWHRIFDEWEANMEDRKKGVNYNSPSPVNRNSPRPVNRSSPKEGQIEEGQSEEDEPGPVNSGSPKEGQLKPVPFGRLDFYH